jgi:RNA-directed DNA polymerase
MERGGPAVCNVSLNREGKDEMIKVSIDLQDLRRRLYVKAKAETSWRFWGLYVHVCKMETLRQAYALAKENDGAPGVDGVTFEAIEEHGVEAFLGQIRDELVQRTYKPLPARKREIPKDGVSSRQGWKSGRVKVPVPSIACIRTVSISGVCGGNKAQ